MQSVDDTRAREVHHAATILTVLVLLSGTLSLAVVPWEPFWFPNIAQSVVCAVMLGYLLRTWKRPRCRVADAICAILIVYTLLLVPWTTVMWCRLGRPLDAFALPEASLVSIALVYRCRSSLALAAMIGFTAEIVFIYVYATHLGLGELIPINGTTGTIGVVAVGAGIFFLCRRRHALARKHVRTRAEIEALERVRPLFVHARAELASQVGVVAAEVRSSASSRPVHRALNRLAHLREQLGAVVACDDLAPSRREAERRLRDQEAQLGAMFLAAVGVAMNAMASVTLHWELYDVPAPIEVKLVLDAVVVLYLAGTMRRPSSRRALWAVITCFVTALATVTYIEIWLLEVHRPYTPCLGHKALMGIIGLTLGMRFRLGVVLIVATAAQAIALWFVLDVGSHAHIVPVAEPWVTLIYMSLALVSLRIVEQGQLSSFRLQRAEAEASAMQRRARMFFALRDRLNSPLQILVFGADERSGPARHAIDRLVKLSRELAALDVMVPHDSISVDASAELRRQL